MAAVAMLCVQEFFKANPVPAAERTVEQSCENIALNARWMEREAAAVTAYLKSKVWRSGGGTRFSGPVKWLKRSDILCC